MRADRWTFLLVLSLGLTAAYALSFTGWSDQLGPVPAAAFFGTLLGWVLARSRFGTRRAAFLFSLYGLGFLAWVLIQESRPPFEISTAWMEGHVRLWLGLTRVAEFLARIYAGRSNADPLIFSLLMSGLTWNLSGFSSWSAFRLGRFWPAVVPSAMGLLAIAYYYHGPVSERTYLGFYLLLGLLLLLHLTWRDQTELWRSQSVRFTDEASYQFARVGVVIALLLLVVAWTAAGRSLTLASPRSQTINAAWAQVRGTFNRWFGDLRSPAGPPGSDYWGATLVLGGGIRLAPVPVMEVQASSFSPMDRFYWQSVTYDEYLDGVWRSTGSPGQSFDPTHNSLQAPDMAARQTLDLTFQLRFPAITRPYLASDPLWVSLPLLLQVDPGTGDLESALSTTPLSQGTQYSERAAILQVDQASLRAAGEDYPDSIRQRYLQLPSSVTARTRELAHSVSATASTPYDQAVLITAFLRNHIAYDTNIPSPPRGQDPVDWVLFDSRRGYCVYYASAEVILLRSLGVPARLAVGFAQGRPAGPQNPDFIVRESDAHAWPEVFFPRIGWIEFEPTASQPPLIRPARLASGPTQSAPPQSPSLALRFRSRSHLAGTPLWGWETEFPWAILFRWMVLAGITFAFGGALFWSAYVYLQGDSPAAAFQDRARSLSARLGRLPAAERPSFRPLRLPLASQGYAWTGRLARWADLAPGTSLTPLERASALKERFPSLAGPLSAIAKAYTADCYSPRSESGRWSRAEQAEFGRARWAVAATALSLLPKYLLHSASARVRARVRARIRGL
ncbi:MAG: transglutaminase-like domain-containing protein [Anaerolineales bacterium]|jgi:transglutaminase-like putative cysteine protease